MSVVKSCNVLEENYLNMANTMYNDYMPKLLSI